MYSLAIVPVFMVSNSVSSGTWMHEMQIFHELYPAEKSMCVNLTQEPCSEPALTLTYQVTDQKQIFVRLLFVKKKFLFDPL